MNMTTPKVGKPHSGFNNGGEICDHLTRDHNNDIKEFTKQLFEQVSRANAKGRHENHVENDRRFLDSFAQILMGDEICAAIAISGSDILIATNKGNQDRKNISSRITGTIIDKNVTNGSLRLGITCQLKSATGEIIQKQIGPLEYQLNCQTNKAFIVNNQKWEFHFEQGEFSYLPDDKIVLGIEFRELNHDYYQFLLSKNINEEFEIQRPVVSCIGALQRRTAKLLNSLSFISNATLRKGDWENLPIHLEPYSQFVKEKYKEYRKVHPQIDAEGFVENIKNDAINRFGLDQPDRDTSVVFLKGAEEHYKALNLYDGVKKLLKPHTHWINILSDSLTYELARHDSFKQHICTDFKSSKGLKEMLTLYEQLAKNYQNFQITHNLKTSVDSVTKWLDDPKGRQSVQFPTFISNHLELFLQIARRYFVNLAFMEEFVKKDAERKGHLAKRLAQENIFKEPNVLIVDGKEEVHAEMRLFSEHLLKHHSAKDYYGIAKLCCALCHYTLKQFEAQGLHPPKTRGGHSILFKWPLPEALERDEHIEHFLGSALFEKYMKIVEKPRRLASPKSGTFYDPRTICARIIERLDGLNSQNNLKKLGIDPHLMMTREENQYPDMPQSNPLSADEQKIQSLMDKYGAKSVDHAFRYAAYRGNEEDMSFLLQTGKANVNSQGEKTKKTALHVAVENGSKEITKDHTKKESYKKVILALLKAGADTRIKDKEGKTPADYDSHNLLAMEC